MKSAKESYNRKLIEDNSGDHKSFWRTLTRLIPGKKVLPRNINEKFEISINGQRIKQVFKYKYLGVVMDDSLSWRDHVHHALMKASVKVGMLRRLRNDISMHTANIVYKSCFTNIRLLSVRSGIVVISEMKKSLRNCNVEQQG